jgi:uncharacterized protein (DUF488 family)
VGFEVALGELLELAHGKRVAIRCAEAVPWRCHRSLIADALVARGVVEHTLGLDRCQLHSLPRFARVEGGRVRHLAR